MLWLRQKPAHMKAWLFSSEGWAFPTYNVGSKICAKHLHAIYPKFKLRNKWYFNTISTQCPSGKKPTSYSHWEECFQLAASVFLRFVLFHSQDQKEIEIEVGENAAISYSAVPQSYTTSTPSPPAKTAVKRLETPVRVTLSFLLGEWVAASVYILLCNIFITHFMLTLPLSWFKSLTRN